MKIIDYLKKQGISYFPIHIRINEDGKKELLPYIENHQMPKQTDFELLSATELCNRFLFNYHYKHIAIDTRFIQQIDIDSEEGRDKFIPITAEHPYFLSSSKRLPHIFTKLDNSSNFGKRFTWDEIDSKVEILNGQWSWCDIDAEVFNSDNTLQNLSIIRETDTKKYNDVTFDYTDQSITVLLELIDKKYIDDYNVWWRIGSALFNCGYPFEVFDNWSKKGSSYSGTKRLWESLSKANVNSIQVGTICYYAKLSNPYLFKLVKDKLPNKTQVSIIDKWIKNEAISALTHATVSDIFYERYYYKYSFSKNFWYRLSPGGIYEKLSQDADTIISKDIISYMQSFLLSVLSKIESSEYKKRIWKSYTLLENQSFLKQCVEFSRKHFLNEKLETTLDLNETLVGFNNGVYDLKNFTFRKGTIEDCVSITTGYDFNDIELTNSDIEFFDNLIDSWFEDKETSYWFKKHVASCIEPGNKEEKIYFWVGSGRNGKGTMDTLLRETLGRYYTDLDNAFFTIYKKNSNQAEPELIKLKNKRITMTTETSGEVKYISEKFKKISGGDIISCRPLYSNHVEEFVPTFKSIIQTNHLPQFTEIDDGLLNRISVIRFPYKFLDTNNYTKDKFHKPCDDNLKSLLRVKKIYFFNYLIKYYKAYVTEGLTDLPLCVAQSIKEYREDIDNVKTFITQAFIRTDTDTDRIPLSDMLNYYNNWSPEKLLCNPFAKRINNHIKTEKKRINNKQVTCICGYKWNIEFKSDYSNCNIQDL
jgi:P4 family phage/plasmid primase-like protien